MSLFRRTDAVRASLTAAESPQNFFLLTVSVPRVLEEMISTGADQLVASQDP